MRSIDIDDKTDVVLSDNADQSLNTCYPFHIDSTKQCRIINKEASKIIARNLLEIVNNEKRRSDSMKTTQKFIIGIGIVAAVGVAAGILLTLKLGKETREDLKKKAIITVRDINDSLQKKAEAAKNFSANSAQDISNTIEDFYKKTDGVKKDIKDGYHEITQDIHKTADNISNDLNESVK